MRATLPSRKVHTEAPRFTTVAYNAGGVEALLTMCTSDVVWHPLPEWLEDPEHRGHEGVRKLLDWFDDFDELAAEIAEIRDTEDQVLVRADLIGRTGTSGVLLRHGWVAVCSDFRGGMIGQWRLFRTRPEALAAAGVDEWSVPGHRRG